MAAFEQPFDARRYGQHQYTNEEDGEELSPREKALRDLFVEEYMECFDQVVAAQRCGFTLQFAVEYGTKFLAEPYVQKRIKMVKMGIQESAPTEKELEEQNRKIIRTTLMEQAHYYGPGSSHAARVSALKSLMVLYGMEVKKSEQTITHKGGVMAVPGIASLDDWEKQASESQDALAAHAHQSGQ